MTSGEAEKDFFSVDLFRPDDAPGVAGLFRAVYGEGYPMKTVYDPAALVAAFERRDNIPAVARGPGGRVIAYQAFYRSAPNKAAYEGGQGLVHPDFRGKGVIAKVSAYMVRELLPGFGAEAIFGEAVCNHIHMQKLCASIGWVETALELSLMPAEAYVAEGSASGRVSALFMGKAMTERQTLVHLPPRYEDALRFFYEGCRERPDYRAGTADLPDSVSRLSTQVFDFAGVARITVDEAGRDFTQVIGNKERELAGRGIGVIQVWLKLSWPFVGACVEALTSGGYFLGGLLPRWFHDSDGLLMQKLGEEPQWENIHLYSKRAEGITEMIRADRAGAVADASG
jgi:hypothetical protein